jgi:X box-binding protein 1
VQAIRAEERRERENLELHECIQTLEMGYEAVLRTLTTQGANPSTLHKTSSSTPILSSTCTPSPASAKSPSTADSETLDLSSIGHTPTCHLAWVATTDVHTAVSLQRVGSICLVTGLVRAIRCTPVLRSRLVSHRC